MILDVAETEENRTELRRSLATIYDRSAPADARVERADGDGAAAAALWSRLGSEFGGAGLAAPVELGGGGAGLAELAVLFELDGARLGCVPLLGSVLALEAVLRSTDQAAAERFVPGLADGAVRGALAWSAPDLVLRDAADGDVVDGTVAAVPDAAGAGVLVTLVGDDLVVVDLTDTAHASTEPLDSLDLTRPLARVRLDGCAAYRLQGRPGVDVLEDVRDVAALLVATELLGVCEQAVAEAVAYAGQREQFGRAIGSFQAVKHVLADAATATDLVRSLVEHATWAAAEAPERLRETAAMAFLAATDAAAFVTAENVQVHGGIGFTWEHPAHLYFRKARADAALLGARDRFVDRVLADATGPSGGA